MLDLRFGPQDLLTNSHFSHLCCVYGGRWLFLRKSSMLHRVLWNVLDLTLHADKCEVDFAEQVL